jgi:adenosyl cobinamide kinase/adenosyl cobinamide phosphate guanylyltransferase
LPDGRLTLVLGGARSGKSRFAEALVTAAPAPWLYLATAEPLDDEMAARIAAHRARRAPGWETAEVPLELAAALAAAPPGRPVLIDCLTLWLSNVLLAGRDTSAESERPRHRAGERARPALPRRRRLAQPARRRLCGPGGADGRRPAGGGEVR